jgi:hypothetical protein
MYVYTELSPLFAQLKPKSATALTQNYDVNLCDEMFLGRKGFRMESYYSILAVTLYSADAYIHTVLNMVGNLRTS